jgi:hypothetical protein
MWIQPQEAFEDRKERALSKHKFGGKRRRSRELLETVLTAEQLAFFDAHGYLHVTGGVTRKKYRIYSPRSYNIKELDATGNVVMSHCVAPKSGRNSDKLPPLDILAGQVLWLQSDGELEFIAKANSFRVDV